MIASSREIKVVFNHTCSLHTFIPNTEGAHQRDRYGSHCTTQDANEESQDGVCGKGEGLH
jgi:hypothetical protein